jgi:acetyl-CoA carboxylase/biotin carboxylase 1
VASVSEKEQLSLRELVGPLVKLARSYEEGREGHARATVGELFNEYMRVEQLFSDQSQVGG